jgi:hypothetical protein
MRKYREANREKINASVRARRARKRAHEMKYFGTGM